MSVICEEPGCGGVIDLVFADKIFRECRKCGWTEIRQDLTDQEEYSRKLYGLD